MDIGNWIVGEVRGGDLAAKVSAFAQSALANKTVDATLAKLNIDAKDLSVALTPDRIQRDIQKAIDAYGAIKVEAKQWEIVLGDNPTVDADHTGQQKAQQSALARFLTFDPIKWAEAKWDIQLDVSPTIILPALAVVNDALQAAADATLSTLKPGRPLHWSIDLESPVVRWLVNSNLGDQVYDFVTSSWVKKSVTVPGWVLFLTKPSFTFEGGFDLGKSIAEKIGSISVPIPSWVAELPAPTLGNALTGSIALGLQIGQAIADKLGDVSVPLPSWSIDVPTPNLGKVFPTNADIEGLVQAGLAGLGDLPEKWPNGFSLDFAMPEINKFPEFAAIADLALAAMQDIGQTIEIAWSSVSDFVLDFGLPTIGSFPSWSDIWTLIWGQLSSLGSFSFSIPFSINPFASHANGGVIQQNANGGLIRAFAGGGLSQYGLSIVGERGPELAALPMGTRIFSHGDTVNMLRSVRSGASGPTVVVNVNVPEGTFLGEKEAFVEYVAREIGGTMAREIHLRHAAFGLTA